MTGFMFRAKLREAKYYVRAYIREWSDEKLAQVLAFASDGKMDYFNRCGCLIGVGTSKVLHSEHCEEEHYEKGFLNHRNGHDWVKRVEAGYRDLGFVSPTFIIRYHSPLRDRRFIAILKAEIRLRDRRKKAAQPVEEGVEVATA